MYLRQNELYEVCILHWPILKTRLTVLQRVQDLDHSFSGLESKAEMLHAAQTRQAEMQAHLHNQSQAEMQASWSLIANVTSSARGLHEAVDDAAAKIAKMAWFGAVPGEVFRLGWLVLAIAVMHWYVHFGAYVPRYQNVGELNPHFVPQTDSVPPICIKGAALTPKCRYSPGHAKVVATIIGRFFPGDR